MKRTELPIRSWVAEIERELARLYLDGHRVGRRWSEIYLRPCFCSERTECQNFRANEKKRGHHQAHRTAWKFPDFGLFRAVRGFPDQHRKNNLRRQKENPRLSHCL